MAQSLRDILDRYRAAAKTEREKGTYFEQLVLAFLRNDPLQTSLYDQAWTYADWAAAHGHDAKDVGIDLVAKLAGDDKFCAVQCKFYPAEYRIRKEDIDSFFTASGKKHFGRRLIIDSTDGNWGPNAEDALVNQNPPALRLSLADLEESTIDWARFVDDGKIVQAKKKELMPHQKDALAAVAKGFAEDDRGKLIMACGTGKTFTGLKIAEDRAGVGKTVLYMVPSLSLMSQSVREWTNDAAIPLRCFAVCSDAQVGRRQGRDDFADIATHDLAYPATTDPKKLSQEVGKPAPDKMTVVFSTYQSIDVISKAQFLSDLGDFDLIICDEAHRTTGAIFEDEEESHFTKVHSNDNVRGAKRLYMTATPRVYGENVRQKAEEASVELCDMDDPKLYGKTFFTRGFAWAVENQLLTDYKVIVLAMDEGTVAEGIQRSLAERSELRLDDATKIIGCYKALSKQDLAQDVAADPQPMRRALAFCKDIKTSKLVTTQFASVVEEYLANEVEKLGQTDDERLRCELDHVDGSFNAKQRERLLKWLKEDTEGACRILSNARCLSEGVDVPALDAILFLHPRKSQIDVVQSVGRVMRRASGKKMGYVILPIAIPAGVAPEDALNDNERYRVVWQILNALRSHDERMDATINKIDLGEDVSGKIEIIAISNTLPERRKTQAEAAGLGQGGAADEDREGSSTPRAEGQQLSLWVDEFASAIMAKIVKKCGRRTYWEDWATKVADIAQTHITRIKAVVDQPGSKASDVFAEFLAELRDDLNPSVTRDEAIEMIAQHIITQPVFDALFEDYEFTRYNPVSKAMDAVLGVVHPAALTAETEALDSFYDSVKRRIAGIATAEAKQKIVVQLYDSFFRNAFPRMTDRLGIVYTPIEIVDFILRSVDEVLQSEFGQTLGSKGVHILDPFTGTGTFITRLLQSGLIKPEQLEHKFRHEIHANEIVLLAYYIAAVNIEAAYHGAKGGAYLPFEGICLTDTFQLYEQDRDLVADLMPDNSHRRTRQRKLDIRVIVGNPPYSAGQGSANDNAANLDYPKLDQRIASTYAEKSAATNKNALYDSYIRALRWATDRVGTAGVIGFVTNAGWIEGSSMDGLRKCLAEEFSDLFIFHLRGNQRTSGERSRREGGKIFGSGSRAPIAISLLVKNPSSAARGRIHFHDIGDYLSREDKLGRITSFGALSGITNASGWSPISPDQHGDWLNQRDPNFDRYIKIGDKADDQRRAIFENYSSGVKTNRDSWCYNSSREEVSKNLRRMVEFYNAERVRLHGSGAGQTPDEFLSADPKKISWNRSLKADAARNRERHFSELAIRPALYRPFQPQWLYFSRELNDMIYQMPRLFPTAETPNKAIMFEGSWRQNGIPCIMVNKIHALMPDGGCQLFPLHLFDPPAESSTLFDNTADFERRDGITDFALKHFQRAYPKLSITKEDVFHYVYGLLHSEEYRERYADNLSKELPRIPLMKSPQDFEAYRDAGRRLGELHVDFESVDPFPVTIKEGDLRLATIKDPQAFYRVEKMKFAGKRPDIDKTTVVYNRNITMTGIPLEAYDYVVNGKPALEWVIERQSVSTDKASGIVNDANRYAIETVGDPAYPMKLFQRVITVSLETMKIVRSLPKLVLTDA